MKMLIKMTLLILGLSPATRNTIRMMLGIWMNIRFKTFCCFE
jgi:hypothetical protein